MSQTFARCRNTDYCSLGDQRLVLRLDAHESLFCPECAQPLVNAPPWGEARIAWPVLGAVAMGCLALASFYLVAQRWPQSALYRAPMYFASPAATPAPPLFMAGVVAAEQPSAGKLYLVTAMDDYLPRAAGDFVLRDRRGRPPRIDPAMQQARADIEAGVPAVPWPEDDTARASMPWRQALILAALVSPAQALTAATAAGDAIAPIDSPRPPAPAPSAAAALSVPAEPPVSTPNSAPPDAMSVRHGIRPQAAGPMTLPGQQAAEMVQLGHADMPRGETRLARGNLRRVVAAVSTAIGGPDSARTNVRAASARKPLPPSHGGKKLARLEPAPRQPATATPESGQAIAAVPVVAPSQPAPAATTADANDQADAAATPPRKIVVTQTGFSMSYTPLKNVNLTSIVMPARPSAATPRMGSLKVDCVVETSGLPSDCHVVHAERASAVSTALLAWMSSGLVHRAPTLRDGHPVRARQSWTLEFPAEARRQDSASDTGTP
jgi:hypothetical protein